MNSSQLWSVVIAAVAVLCSVWIISCEALYEDQVGAWDWRQEYVGKVTHAVFQTHGSGRKRVIVATEQNCLASLNLRTGEMYWRRVLGDRDSVRALEISLGKYAISLSGDNSILRSWHLPDGVLHWETYLHPSLDSASSLLVPQIDINGDRANDLVVFTGGVLFAISSVDGSILWRTDLTTEVYIIRKIVISPDGQITGVGFTGTSGLVVVEIDPPTGFVQVIKTISVSRPLSDSELSVVNGVVVTLSSDGSFLVAALIDKNSDVEAIETSLIDLVSYQSQKLNAEPFAKLLPTKLDGAVAVALNRKVIVLKVGRTGILTTLEEFPDMVSISDTLEVVGNKHAVAVVQSLESAPNTADISVRVVYSDNWKENGVEDTVKLDVHHGSIRKVFLNAYVRLDRSYGFRALVVSEDDSLSLLQQGEVVWVREDGLATIVDTITSELPVEREGHTVAAVEHDVTDRLKDHVLKLKATLFLANSEETAALQAKRLNSEEKTKMTRDHNGFRKLLIVLTKAGKVFALHTGDGRIVWSVLLSNRAQFPSGKTISQSLKLFPWQIPHKHALDENPVALVLGQPGPEINGQGIITWVDLHKGVELKSLKLNFLVKLMIPLPATTASEERLHLVVDNQLKVHVYPRTQESFNIFITKKADTFFYVVDKEKGQIHGYGILESVDADAGNEADGYVFNTERIWSVVFPSKTEVISTVVARRQDEVVHTQTKILGNRDALFKHLSKNLIFVATVTPKAAGHIGEATPEEAGLVAYLIDTVTGRVLHRVSHPNMQGPVHAVFSENWVVYHYFNLKMYQYEMTVMEVYDEDRLRDKGALQLMLGRHNGTAPLSSFSTPSIDVRMQTYFFTFTVKTLTVTSTARGITGKQLLVGTINDQVLALDKRFFDPRRSANPTPAEREEGILPLTDAIPIIPQTYLSHAYQLAGLRGILTVPASLESTSLVFVYGVDLFYTQTAPSRTYDSLTEDFSYALLLITIVALVIGITVTYIWSEHKELAERWK